jgi:hypothetical protein
MVSKVEEFRLKLEKEIFKNRFVTVFNSIGDDLFKELVISNCLPSMGLLISEQQEEDLSNICKECNKGILISNKCNICLGIAEEQLINYTKYSETASQLLDFPTNETTIIINGKKIKIDLTNVNNWIISNPTPQLKYYKKGVDDITNYLNEIRITLGIDTNSDILETIFTIFWNITTYFDKQERGIIRPKEAKKSFYILSIYYGFIYKGIDIDISRINKVFQLPSKTIIYYNSFIIKIFKNGFLADYVKTDIFRGKINYNIPDFDNEYGNHILDFLIDKNIIDNDIYAYAGIVLYLSKDIFDTYKYSKNAFILKTFNITSTNILNNNYYKISNYFDKFPMLKDAMRNKDYI